MPMQLLKPSLRELAFNRVHLATSRERTVLHTLPTVDVEVFRAALLSDVPESQHHNNVIHMVSTLSAVDQSLLHRFDATDDDTCTFCHRCKSSIHHCLWYCDHPVLEEARRNTSEDRELTLLDHVDCLPLPLLYGIPPKLSLQPCGPWWDNQPITALHDNT
eukprot:7122547-Karenia_brevis.AAC.1